MVAALLPRNGVRAGHDGTNVMHLGESNAVPPGATTQLEADVGNHALTVRNNNGGDSAGAIRALASAPHKAAVLAESDSDESFAIAGVSSGPGFGEAGQFGMGNGTGVQGLSHGGTGVEGQSQTGPGGSFHSQDSTGVEGHSQTGLGGEFSTNGGSSAVAISGNAVGFALGLENSAVGEDAGGILANTRGGKPGVEADVFASEFSGGVGLQGVSYSGTSYEDGEYGEGPGTGVQGISGDGAGVEGRSQRGSGVIGFAGGGPATPPPYGVPGLGHLGVAGFAPVGDDPFGIGALGTGQIGMHGFGGLFGVDGRAENAIAGNFVNYAGSEAGAGVRAISPGDRPAVIAWSGSWAKSDEDILPPASIVSDGGIALDIIGKARFSSAGTATVPAGANSVVVNDPHATANSHISITLVSDPGPRSLRWVQRQAGSFTVNFAGGPPGQRPATNFAYLIAEPGG